MKILFPLFLIMIIALQSNSIKAQTIITNTIVVDGLERNYRLAIPSDHDINSSVPLVINMHGFGSNAAEQEFYADMNRIAEREGFIICYPNGIANAWNVGWNFGSQADDVSFIDKLSDFLIQEYNLDTEKIYACGMSNGGFMSYRLACELNNKFAAIASVTGSIAPEYIDQCDPGREVPILQFHGTADNTVLYEGLEDVNIPIDSLIKFWTTNNSCSEEGDTMEIEDINTSDNSTVKRISYADCAGDSEVLFYKIDGGGHTWPGAFLNIGITNQDIKASEIIWEFFKSKSLNNQTSSTDDQDLTSGLSVFPNPSVDAWNISTTMQLPVKVTVFDFQGKMILNQQLNYGEEKLNINDLQHGIYVIQLSNKIETRSLKVVKN
jgi:polyhydroxybutyrate depolymerase